MSCLTEAQLNAYASGRILSFDDERVYGYGRQKVAGGPVGHRADAYHLFAAEREGKGTRVDRKGKAAPAKPALLWADTGAPIARALVTDGKLMALAGPPDTGERADDVLEFRDDPAARDGFEGRKGVVLRVVRADNGKPLVHPRAAQSLSTRRVCPGCCQCPPRAMCRTGFAEAWSGN